MMHTGLGTTGTLTPAFLLVDTPHRGTTFEIVGSTGVAVAVLAVCLALAERGGRVTAAVLAPFAAVGALAASLYAAHIAVIALLDGGVPSWRDAPWTGTALFLAGAIVIAVLWRRLIGRGPVEWLLHTLSTLAGNPRW
jgi:uncharacterized membrane protein YeiB